MSQNSKIEWTDHTFNPWEGCQKVSPGCDHCYAETRNARFAGGAAVNWGPGAPRRRTSVKNWTKPLHWNAQHAAFFAEHGRRQRVFCASLADVFDNAVRAEWRADLFALITATPNLDWLLLTKRIGNARTMMADALHMAPEANRDGRIWPLPNVWLGASIVNQEEADRDIPKLLATPAAKRFLSMEPLLGPVDLAPGGAVRYEIFNPDPIGRIINQAEAFPEGDPDGQIDWIIVGGESGPGARPMHPEWARSLRDQCKAAGVQFLFKQWGEWAPLPTETHFYGPAVFDFGGGQQMQQTGKKAAGRLLDGVQHDGYPGAPA